jgi:hypothetical protein
MPCNTDDDCWKGNGESISTVCADGKCTGFSKLGEYCFDSEDCDVGLFCNEFEEHCEALKEVGEKCSDSEECNMTSFCSIDTQICEPFFSRKGGQPCNRLEECESLVC